MFVSIDMDKLVFLHKHHDHDVVSGLAFLEAPDRSTMIENTERPGWFSHMSQLDIQMLYKNSTGFDMAYKWIDVQKRMMATLAGRLPATLALAEEVEAQVAAVEADLHKGVPYKYALGARVPAAAQELFPLQAKRMDDKDVAKAERDTPPPPPPGAQPAKPAAAAPQVADSVAQPAKGPRQASVRPAVRQAADDAMAAMGKAPFLAQWPQQRALLIEQLTLRGFHPTTVRIKLSEWAKEHGL